MSNENRTIILGTNVFEAVKRNGDKIREELKRRGTYLVNIMSSPGAGKTTTLVALINLLKKDYRIGVMEADIDSDVDAIKISDECGVKSIQLHTDSLCYLDSDMVEMGLTQFMDNEFDLIFIENIGNMVCPSFFDTGACLNVCILSVPEGDKKPFNYPLMFDGSDLVILNKIDSLPYFQYDLDKVKEFVREENPNASFIPYSAKTKEGLEDIASYLKEKIQDWRKDYARDLQAKERNHLKVGWICP